MKIRVVMATISGAITIFILGYLIYGILLASYMKENMFQYVGLNKEPKPDFVPLILSNAVKAFLLLGTNTNACWRFKSRRNHNVPRCSEYRSEFPGVYESLGDSCRSLWMC